MIPALHLHLQCPCLLDMSPHRTPNTGYLLSKTSINTSTLGKLQLFIRIALLILQVPQNKTTLVYLQLKPPSHTLENLANEEQ